MRERAHVGRMRERKGACRSLVRKTDSGDILEDLGVDGGN